MAAISQCTDCQDGETRVLHDTVIKEAVRIGHSFKGPWKAQFDDITVQEREKIDKQVFPDNLMFSAAVNLEQSKKAFVNFLNGLDDSAEFGSWWDLPPHNPHRYRPPVGT